MIKCMKLFAANSQLTALMYLWKEVKAKYEIKDRAKRTKMPHLSVSEV